MEDDLLYKNAMKRIIELVEEYSRLVMKLKMRTATKGNRFWIDLESRQTG